MSNGWEQVNGAVERLLGAILASLILAELVCAERQETVITSEKVNVDLKQSTAKFNGKVIVVSPRMRIASDELTVEFNGTNSVKSVTAAGNVRINLPEKTATSTKAVYIDKEHTLVLTGNAKVVMARGGGPMIGDRNMGAADSKLRIESDELTVEFTSANSVKSATAVGNVRINLPEKTATSTKAVYIEGKSMLILTGNAKVVVRDRNSVKGDTITIWLEKEMMTSEPARLEIVPEDKNGGAAGLLKNYSGQR
jgi:lipopolysaccharide transport protein LptA